MEHEISVITGYQALEAIDRTRWEPFPVYLDSENVWYVGEELNSLDFFRQDPLPLNRLERVYAAPDPSRCQLRLRPIKQKWWRTREWAFDLVLPATHGTYGEDGSLQGLLEMANIPYVGAGVAGSALGMDKILTKRLLSSGGLPVLTGCEVHKQEWETNRDRVVKTWKERLGFPMIVKPATLGSSIGVSKVEDEEALKRGVDFSLRFGDWALGEPYCEGAKDLNCAVIDGDPPIPSLVEEPIRERPVLTFEEKYLKGKKGKKAPSFIGSGMASLARKIPAEIDEGLSRQIQSLSCQAFTLLRLGGVARVDFLLSPQGELYVNEVNTIPGSFAYYLWEPMGKSFRELIDYLLERAREVHRRKNRVTYTLPTRILH